MAKKKAFIPLLYLASIVFFPWWISLSFLKSLESWVTNWWNTSQSAQLQAEELNLSLVQGVKE